MAVIVIYTYDINMAVIEYIIHMDETQQVFAILVAMQWANEDRWERYVRTYVEKESGELGTVGSTVGEERRGRCRAQNDR